MADKPKNLPTLEDMKRLVNEVFNYDTNDVDLSNEPPEGSTMKNENSEAIPPEGAVASDTTNKPPAGEAGGEGNKGGDAPMTVADLAEAVGVDEKKLMELLKATTLLEKPGLDAILSTISTDEKMYNQLVGLLKEASGQEAGDAGGII